MTIDRVQSMSDFCHPFIVDDSFDPSAYIGDIFFDQFQDAVVAKSGPLLSMSSYEKASRRDMLEPYASAPYQESASYAYNEGSYAPQQYYEHVHPVGTPDSEYYYSQEENLRMGPSTGHESMPASVAPIRRQSNLNGSQGNVLQHLEPHTMPMNPRKRRASDAVQYDVLPPQKRIASAQIQVQPSAQYYDASGQNSPYSPFIATPASTGSLQPTQAHFPHARPMGHHYSTSNASQVSLAAPSPHTPVWSPSFATVKTEPSPPAPMTPVPRPATASPFKSSLPRLVRTSTINQHHASPSMSSSMSSIHPASFNPYAMYPLKASLKLRGDLDSMTKGWTAEEIDARRRLVEFKRSQDGSIIAADFNPVTPQERPASSITISCILWKEKKEYYVTSVDTIYLLEALVGVRFTVEEKNRIRRNLEGFRPATVSKSKTDSEDFFKTIMGFPHPKPRNIEKDVKVFPWKILAHALKKIISKYSASYSSTASALLTPLPSNYASTENSADFNYPPTPQQEYNHPMGPAMMSNSMAYAHNQMHGRMSVPVTTAPVPELQLQVPTMGPAYDNGDYSFAAMPGMPHASMILTPEAMSAPVRMQPSWEYNHFVNDSPVTTAPQSAPPAAYHRGPIETADFGPPTIYHQMR